MPMRGTELLAALSALDRRSRFELVGEISLDFPTHHPQGMAFAKGLTFLSSVEILDAPRPAADPALRTRGRGTGTCSSSGRTVGCFAIFL
ncbi:conserved hypothetical protein [Arthrobacter sp. Hiyo8]|nr:conserved hypothetical protein [Arthrobacter sp. Hiyo8]